MQLRYAHMPVASVCAKWFNTCRCGTTLRCHAQRTIVMWNMLISSMSNSYTQPSSRMPITQHHWSVGQKPHNTSASWTSESVNQTLSLSLSVVLFSSGGRIQYRVEERCHRAIWISKRKWMATDVQGRHFHRSQILDNQSQRRSGYWIGFHMSDPLSILNNIFL